MSLIDYAKTERQRQAIKAWEDCGEVVAKAAGVLGVSPSTVRDHIGAVKNFAAQRGYTEHWDSTHLVGPGETVIGRSVYSADPDGNKTWLKTKRTAAEAEKAEAFNAFVEQLCQGVIPVKRKAKGKKVRKDDLATAPTMREVDDDKAFRVVSLEALVRMKLTSFRFKDRVHLLDMIEVGLIDDSWPPRFSKEFGKRLQQLVDNPDG